MGTDHNHIDAETNGILGNNQSEYAVTDPGKDPVVERTDDEKIDRAANGILDRFRSAFEELAK